MDHHSDLTDPEGEQPAREGEPSNEQLAAMRAPTRRTLGEPREPHRASAGEFARSLGIVVVTVLAIRVHVEILQPSPFPSSVIWLLACVVMIAAATAVGAILTGRCVGFVPTMIICCTAGITLAAIAYAVGEHVARWLT